MTYGRENWSKTRTEDEINGLYKKAMETIASNCNANRPPDVALATLSDEQIAYIKSVQDKYPEDKPKYNHYFKDVSNLESIDIYRVLDLWEVTHPCLQHAAKKILVAGNRGHKDISKDIQEAIDSLERWQEMNKEDNNNKEVYD